MAVLDGKIDWNLQFFLARMPLAKAFGLMQLEEDK